MPLVDVVDATGTKRRVRAPYVAADYTVPAGVCAALLASCAGLSVSDQLAERGSQLSAYTHLGDVVHDGVRYARLLSPERTAWVVDVAYDKDEVRPVPPEEAWRIARAGDAATQPPIELAPG